ncbi:MAG: hypothetical protein L3K06_04135 [Thermoplasmata archaeon]|nr:hypothetical protein [Thermoplasmata archaeon]
MIQRRVGSSRPRRSTPPVAPVRQSNSKSASKAWPARSASAIADARALTTSSDADADRPEYLHTVAPDERIDGGTGRMRSPFAPDRTMNDDGPAVPLATLK